MKRKTKPQPKVIPVFEPREESPLPMKSLPSIEEVYKRLDDFVKEEEAKLPHGASRWHSYKILKAENMKDELFKSLLKEVDKIDYQKDFDGYLRELSHACKLYLNKL